MFSVRKKSALKTLATLGLSVMLGGCSFLKHFQPREIPNFSDDEFLYSQVGVGNITNKMPEEGFMNALSEGTFIQYVQEKTKNMTEPQKIDYYKSLGAECDQKNECKIMIAYVAYYINSCYGDTKCIIEEKVVPDLRRYIYIMPRTVLPAKFISLTSYDFIFIESVYEVFFSKRGKKMQWLQNIGTKELKEPILSNAYIDFRKGYFEQSL